MTIEELDEILKNISVSLDGGNDSGYIEVKGLYNTSLENIIEDKFYDLCEYGSFAGNFSVSGIGYYDSIEKCIILEADELDEENTIHIRNENIEFNIPKSIKGTIDFITYTIDITYGSTQEVGVRVVLKNGVWTDDHQDLEDLIIQKLNDINVEYFVNENNTVTLNKEDEHFDIEIKEYKYAEYEKIWKLSLNNIYEELCIRRSKGV